MFTLRCRKEVKAGGTFLALAPYLSKLGNTDFYQSESSIYELPYLIRSVSKSVKHYNV